METIIDKTDWLRKASRRKVAAGMLQDPRECKSMAATIGRWNREEGRFFGIHLKQSINYNTGYVQVTRIVKRKEA